MYKEQKSTEHQRDYRGRVSMDKSQKKDKHKRNGFTPVLVTGLVLSLAITGLLLHASMQNNEKNLARIDSIQRGVTTVQQAQHEPPQAPNPQLYKQPKVLPAPEEAVPEETGEPIDYCEDGRCYH